MRARAILTLALVLSAAPRAHAAATSTSSASLDDQARFIAGLPVPASSPLHAREETAAWKAHAEALGQSWEKYEAERRSKMAEWAAAAVAKRIQPKAPVVYLFGGPDAISVDVIYPEAPLYVLAGLEPIHELPRLESLTDAELEKGLSNIRDGLRNTIELSFFVTDLMGKSLSRTKLRGVIPYMFLFLARNHDRVLELANVQLDRAGKVVEGHAKLDRGVPGIRIRYERESDGSKHELYYFRMDISDGAIPRHPGMFPFLKALGPANAFLKAASFILHDKHFSATKAYLLDHSATILQDDSGIPFHAFNKARWDLVLFGQYTPSRKAFKDHWQPDMKKAWAEGHPEDLPFNTGYRHVVGSNLLLAIAKR